MPKVREFLLRLHAPIWLGVLVAVILILRIPSFFEPYYYGDEMIYLTLGQGIRQGVPLYSHLHDNKPPLIYLLAALAPNLFWFKVALAAFNVASVLFFWKLATALFSKKERLIQVSTIVFGLLTTLPLLEGNTVNAELLMVVPTLAAFWMLFNKGNVFFAGVLFGLASLFKIPAAFEMPVILVFWLLTSNFKLKKAISLVLGFFFPLALSLVWYFLIGAGREYLAAAYFQNVSYVGSWEAPGPSLLARLGLLGLGSAVLFLFRKKLSKQFLFLSLWMFFALFAITLSARPYPHYLIQAVAPASILFAILITEKTLEQSLTVFPLSLFFLIPSFYNFWTYPTTEYYTRFLGFISGKSTRTEYFNRFDLKVSRNYQIAEILESVSSPKQKIFVWGGDSPTIYALSRRLPPVKYVADYHVFDYSTLPEVAASLAKEKPKIIVVLPEARPFPELRRLIKESYLLIDNANLAEIWRLSK